MSCAFLNCGETCKGTVGQESSPPACPYTVLSNGMHAMAQPLTVLRGALGSWQFQGSMNEESKRYIEMSAKQIARMGELLSCMRDVLDTTEGEPKRTRIEIGELMGLVLEGMCSDLREWKGTIVRVGPSDPVYMCGDAERTERALRAAFRVLVSISPSGGTIWASVRPEEKKVEVKLEQKAAHGKALGFSERLSLSLVETSILAQGGSYECIEDPLCISFSLPAQSSEAPAPGPALDCAQTGFAVEDGA